MAPHSRTSSERPEGERYREAAEAALGQLDWVIDYMQRIKRPRIAAALRRNRVKIGDRMG